MDLRALRHRAKLRIIDVAYHLHIAEGTVRNWEKGRTIITLRLDLVAKLCTLYDCSVHELNDAMQESRAKAIQSSESE